MPRKGAPSKRELREQEKSQKILKHSQNNAAQKASQEKPVAVPAAATAAAKPDGGKKSRAKAAGVKSVFAVGDMVYMTSFGRGNDAKLEKKIVGVSCEDIEKDDPAYNVTDVTESAYSVEGHRGQSVSAAADNPVHHKDGDSLPTDMLCLKPTLERVFFGRELDDNLHIQLIYNILDIEKILAVYSTNAVYALNNLTADESAENSDFFLTMTTDNTYVGFCKKNEKTVKTFDDFVELPRLAYYADAFYEKNDKKTSRRSKEEIYAILAMIGKLRHWCVHSEEGKAEYWLYKLDNLDKEFTDVLNSLYDRSVNEINHDFVETNKVNIQILQNVCGSDDLPGLVRAYYEFLITKKHKNLGFSIKKLRENMLAETSYTSDPASRMYDKNLNSIRKKLYQMTDFILYLGYQRDSGREDALVNKLRSCVSDDGIEAVYSAEASNLWDRYKEKIDKIAGQLDEDKIKAFKEKELDIPDSVLGDCYVKSADKVSNFTKLIYLLTRFLSGKEINDLLTTLINKFDNIRSFMELMDDMKLDRTFSENYSFFEDSRRYLEELTELNSFARSCSFDISSEKIMYRDAMDILGIRSDMSDDEIDRMIQNIMQVDANGKNLPVKDNGLRNFISNNVIKSNRFRYLVRYGNPKKIRETAKCEAAVKFVLNGIPDSQIDRYYETCTDGNPGNKRVMLAKLISEISFEKFEDAGKTQKANVDDRTADAEIKRKNQALIRLYLTVMYLMLKNLVNVNARYVIGFHCLERDAKLYKLNGLDVGRIDKNRNYLTEAVLGITQADRNASGEVVFDWTPELAEKAANRHLRKKRWNKFIFHNSQNSNKKVLTQFRNTVCHLNAIRNINTNIAGIEKVESYFALYHYIIQNHISAYMDSRTSDDRCPFFDEYTYTDKCINSFKQYRTYCKDFVKAYCTPFAYNLVRYKNLTIDGLFDRNEFMGK